LAKKKNVQTFEKRRKEDQRRRKQEDKRQRRFNKGNKSSGTSFNNEGAPVSSENDAPPDNAPEGPDVT
jgi:hypothetical protein